jgi:hypothetical protein
MNVYLFEKSISPLMIQKNMRELELIVQECILTAIRESIPTEEIIKAYMDEAVEHEEEIIIENIDEPVLPVDNIPEDPSAEESSYKSNSASEEMATVPSIQDMDDKPVLTRLQFNDYDSVMDENNRVDTISAPKTIERLEEISTERAIQRKLEEEDDLDEKITIHTDSIPLDGLVDLERRDDDYVSLDDIEELN